jgi:hypothetical protein
MDRIIYLKKYKYLINIIQNFYILLYIEKSCTHIPKKKYSYLFRIFILYRKNTLYYINMSITEQEFDAALDELMLLKKTKQWTELEVGKIYTILDTKGIDTKYGRSMVLTINNVGDVWAPKSLAIKIDKAAKKPPHHVRPTGSKPCKNNENYKWQSYDLIP